MKFKGNPDKPYFDNNARKRVGLPMRRKKDKRKRKKSRLEIFETLDEFFDYLNRF